MPDPIPFPVHPLRRVSTSWFALGLAATLGMSPALAEVSQPTAAGVLSGTIVDWPVGSTGTLRLVNNEYPDFANAPIDKTGRFSIQLPTPDPAKLPVTSGLFAEKSNLSAPENGCKGQGTATPSTGHLNTFGLFASVGDQPPQELKLTTDPTFPRPVGSVTSDLTYFDLPTTLEGSVTCNFATYTFHGTFPAGWSLQKNMVNAGTTVAVFKTTVTPEPLPAALSWRLRDQYAGIGVAIGTPESGGAGFAITALTPGRPAALAGVQVGDLLVEIDGQDVTKLSLSDATTLLRGGPLGAAAGSTVILGVRRGTNPAILHFTLTRVLFK